MNQTIETKIVKDILNPRLFRLAKNLDNGNFILICWEPHPKNKNASNRIETPYLEMFAWNDENNVFTVMTKHYTINVHASNSREEYLPIMERDGKEFCKIFGRK